MAAALIFSAPAMVLAAIFSAAYVFGGSAQ
ncbi:hypothetical protein GGR33_004613 [Methylobacterium brachythecii]|uniref:Uncharacterized protein n=1 Tax=Methylobacterium brachythecii TaxID=1176177 RepID=A0A7W6APX4_9HYPH|nr:hypothetical protein [Methylobacterium brachythecii]